MNRLRYKVGYWFSEVLYNIGAFNLSDLVFTWAIRSRYAPWKGGTGI